MRPVLLWLGLGVLMLVGGWFYSEQVVFGRFAEHLQPASWAFPLTLLGLAGSLLWLGSGIRIAKRRSFEPVARIVIVVFGLFAILLWALWCWATLAFCRILRP